MTYHGRKIKQSEISFNKNFNNKIAMFQEVFFRDSIVKILILHYTGLPVHEVITRFTTGCIYGRVVRVLVL